MMRIWKKRVKNSVETLQLSEQAQNERWYDGF